MSFGASTTQPTGSLFSGGAFGSQQSQPAQASSLFGGGTFGQAGQQQQQQQQQQPQQQTGGLFGNTQQQPQQQQQQSQPTGSLFSSLGQNQNQNQNQSTQQAPTGGLFGQTQQQPQQQQPTGSLFGGAGTQTGGGLFGGSTTQAGTGGGLFGGATTQTGSGGGLFGGASNTANTATNTNNTAPGGLFGQSSTSAFGGGLGNTQINVPKLPTLNTFGAPANPLFRQPTQQTNLGATTTQQPAGGPPFTKTTKFNDLPDNIKRLFEGIDTQIQGRVQISNELKRRKLGEEAAKSQDLIRGIHKELVSVISDLQSDSHHVRDLKTKTEQTVQDTIVAVRIIDGFRNPQQHGAYLKNHASFPLEFFQRVTDEMRDRMRWYKTTIEQIERKLSSAALQSQATPHAIQSTLEAQHATFMALASKTAALDTELQKIKVLYTQLWRARTGSMRDPFDDLDRATGDFGLESLSTKY